MPGDDFYKKKIASLLHDPPNKPWIVSGLLRGRGGHEAEARSLATQIFGQEIADLLDPEDIKQSDILAASFDRWVLSFLMKKEYRYGAFMTKDVRLFNVFYCETPYAVSPNPPTQINQFIDTMRKIHDMALQSGKWRLSYLSLYAAYENIWIRFFGTPGPADTRIPTHSVFDHTYATASTLNMVGNGKVHGFLVAVDLGGVQNFIAASRKLRDMWASSWLTSSLAWSIVSPFIKEFGPDVLVLPTARGNPFFYHTLTCMLKDHGLSNIPEEIEWSARSAGYKIEHGYPQHAVVPATVTMILPSATSHPDDAFLDLDGKKLELSDVKQISEYIQEIYTIRWRRIVRSVLDELRIDALSQVFDQLSVEESPPLPLRVAAAEVKVESPSEEAYLSYHRAFRQISTALKNAAGLKVSPSVLMNLTDYTRNYLQLPQAAGEPRFYVCTVCGEVPALPNFLTHAKAINSIVNERNLVTVEEVDGQRRGERLCPYCLIKRLSTTGRIFPRIVENLLCRHREVVLPRFPSVSSVSAVRFKEAVVQAAERQPDRIKQVLKKVIDSTETLEIYPAATYGPEQKLVNDILKKHRDSELVGLLGAFVLGDAEDILLTGARRGGAVELMREVRKILGRETSLNTYFAFIKGDGDDVGKVVSGEIGKVGSLSPVKDIFTYLSAFVSNEKLKQVLVQISSGRFEEASRFLSEELGEPVQPEEVRDMLQVLENHLRTNQDSGDEWRGRIVVSPAYHAVISRSLMSLARMITETVEDGELGGFVVYSGGDDVLAVCPVNSAVKTVLRIRKIYQGGATPGFNRLKNEKGVEGLVPSLGDLGQSFSITYAHYRYPLSASLKVGVEALEEKAKAVKWEESATPFLAKDSVVLNYVPRGGRMTQAVLPFRTTCKQVGSVLENLLSVLEMIERGLLSNSVVKDMREWMGRMTLAAGKAFAKKLISHVIGRNVLKSLDRQEVDRLADFFVSYFERRWRPVSKSTVGDEGRTLSEEYVESLVAEMDAR
ncbi:MAG: type III-B CRISPR-associated protein Cas10/Cmr2, partial [Candidatus Caldarchaeum sp.]|nr:type III-B CRISPR-associated protein Cas10/Cmr2 [Candidatus Caldarchaeum sp.]MDW8435938.1 type III-B CRISPR-associated protein Cas10/Cmr2 [Candidatus Caldarchaeum sp.]